MIAQQIVAIAPGYDDLNDHQTLPRILLSNWPRGGSGRAASRCFLIEGPAATRDNTDVEERSRMRALLPLARAKSNELPR